ncbi:MAG: isopentenyl phosphate kinase family protein [Methanobrevibacter sp.]|nr:isopentenyl phosphate kinase family protein [Candidatus Methanoflexus mossambicus]
MIILKLGGSILTDKNSKIPLVDFNNLNRIAIEISQFIGQNSDKYYTANNNSDDNSNNSNNINNINNINNRNSNNSNNFNNFNNDCDNTNNTNNNLVPKMVIVHGAGSFGHPPAKEYKIGESFSDEEYPNKRIGFSKTQSAVKELNNSVCNVLLKNNIPVVSIQTSAILTTDNGRINYCNIDIIKNFLNNGFIPILYGDVVLDKSLKIAVISGDQIITYLADNLIFNNENDVTNNNTDNNTNNTNTNTNTNTKANNNSNKIVLSTDVDGVFNKNPKTNVDAKLINCLSSLSDLEQLDSTTNVDVTGGMVGKIKELLDLAKKGIDSFIINANVEGNIFNVLNGNEVKGTLISNECMNKKR